MFYLTQVEICESASPAQAEALPSQEERRRLSEYDLVCSGPRVLRRAGRRGCCAPAETRIERDQDGKSGAHPHPMTLAHLMYYYSSSRTVVPYVLLQTTVPSGT